MTYIVNPLKHPVYGKIYRSNLTKRKKRRNRPEHEMQKAFFQWLKLAYPMVYDLTFAIPNGGSRHKLEAMTLKAEGVKRGVPDVFVALPTSNVKGTSRSIPFNGGLFIEFKSGKNKPSKEQDEMLKKLKDAFYCCHVCYSLEEAKEVLREYLSCR